MGSGVLRAIGRSGDVTNGAGLVPGGGVTRGDGDVRGEGDVRVGGPTPLSVSSDTGGFEPCAGDGLGGTEP